jgi:oxygen-independent coproporphyrinogen-3 oxidase
VYCDFAVTVRRTGDLPAWLEALAAELAIVEREALLAPAASLDTLYVGGGTPSLLGPGAMAGLRTVLGPDRLRTSDLEWTAEANPESFTPEVARSWAEAGVNRLSLGMQTFDESALRWMGRLHGADGPPKAVSLARDVGIENVSVDLIFGLPHHLGRSWDADLTRVLELEVPHVSLYGLTVEHGTQLGRAVREGKESPVDEEQYRSEFLRAAEVFTAAGYIHYEVSNFALPGQEARHNSVYWQGDPYLGIGNGAHSFAPPVRRWNVRDWGEYRMCLASDTSPEAEREIVDDEAGGLERAWLGLRTRSGIPWSALGSNQEKLVQRWISQGLAERDEGQVRLTVEGWLLLDQLAVDLDGVRSAG